MTTIPIKKFRESWPLSQSIRSLLSLASTIISLIAGIVCLVQFYEIRQQKVALKSFEAIQRQIDDRTLQLQESVQLQSSKDKRPSYFQNCESCGTRWEIFGVKPDKLKPIATCTNCPMSDEEWQAILKFLKDNKVKPYPTK